MKFRMINLGYQSTPDYPYDYRIELMGCELQDEREQIADWLKQNQIPHITTGWVKGTVLYLRKTHAEWFALRWS